MQINYLSNASSTAEAVNKKVINSSVQNEIKPSNEYMSSNISNAMKAYAMPQISFEGKWDKMLLELKSPKQSNKIKMSFDEASKLLEKFGFTQRGGKGSHCNFVKDGFTPITIARPHDGHNTVKPYIIDALRDYVNKNNVTNI